MRLSAHLRLEECEVRLVDGRPVAAPDRRVVDQEHLLNLVALAHAVFEPLRLWANCPIIVTSGYRPDDRASQHARGEALDLSFRPTVLGAPSEGTWAQQRALRNRAIAALLPYGELEHLPFDQAVGYAHTSHIHVSYHRTRTPRRQVLWQKDAAGGKLQALPPTWRAP